MRAKPEPLEQYMGDPLSNDLASLKIDKVTDSTPQRGKLVWVVGFFGGALLLAGAWAVGAPYLEAKLFKTEVEFTEVLSISPATVSTEVTASGYVIPQLISKVGTKIEGKIHAVNAAEGQKVARGDVLLTLDAADQKSAIAAGQARVAFAQAEAQKQRVQLADSERKLKREQTLSAEGVTGRATVEDLDAQTKTLSQAVQAAEANVLAAKAELQTLVIGLDHLTIRAPIDGTVVTKPPEMGEVVSPGKGPILEIADFRSLMVEAEVPESRLSKIEIGGPCEIMLEAYPTKRYRGVVKEISPTVNRSKATVVVKVGFVGEATGVLPNMAARAFFLENHESADQIGQPPKTVVPSTALFDKSGTKMVFVVEEDRVRMTPVTLGPAFGSGFELKEGPRVGTRLVKNPAATLADGQQIKERKSP